MNAKINDPYSKESIRKVGYAIFLSNILISFALALPNSYIAYAFTDLAGIDPTTMSACLLVVNTIAIVNTVISGAFVQRTRSKFGQYRPWILFTFIATMVGGFMIFSNFGSNKMLIAVVISIGYLIANSSMDYIFTAKNGLYTNIAGDDSDRRTLISARAYQGSNIGWVISGACVLPMVYFFSKTTNEAQGQGFRLTQLVLLVMVVIGAWILFKVGAPYDKSNKGASIVKEDKVSFFEMLKGVIVNRPAAILILCDILRMTGMNVMLSLQVYQCTYVLGDMMAMSYVLSTSSFAAVIGATLAPSICKKLGGRKKAAYLFSFLTGASCLGICFFGQTFWGFVIPAILCNFFMSFIDTIDVPMYFDAGEYWLFKTGKDTRAYIVSMYNVAMKIGIALGAVTLGVVLNLINYKAGMTLTAQSATSLTWIVGLSPAVGYLLPLVLLLFHNVSDRDAERYIKENSEKYSAENVN